MIRKQIQITTCSPEETRHLGRQIGDLLDAPAVIALTGDLGSGKTAFVQGLARGLEVPAEYYITSPTFTLINEYPGRFPLYHVDLYRIAHHLAVADIGLHDLLAGDGVVAIEWAEKIADDLPPEHWVLEFAIKDDETRQIDIFAYGHEAVNLLRVLELQLKSDRVKS
ncbi:MAG: tRNA (adenosine(37)-N6)-threonylcarbamoyltransferase complex ATPase subunit type 1 TsaE [Desulfobacterales bacterium]|nr:MAG: tRNA (adenosine(37)-N6)-threonylcarbamoyltransferase complex ATPase subunit type 1 TsaE [Desulfobacterales bacterium]